MALQVRLPEDLHASIRMLTEHEDRPLNRTIIRLLRIGMAHYYDSVPGPGEGFNQLSQHAIRDDE